ncbi:MAG: DUF4282 domain-containing protein [Acidimicrobiales bacterium]|nr:DUF4282 domain-containing protein [Acidimicrobiales bacterium]
MTEPTTNTQTGSFFGALFDTSFSNLITMRFLKVIYTVILVLSGLGVLVWVFAAFDAGGAVAFVSLIVGLAGWLLYVILIRVSLEVIAVLFKISENTSRMTEALEQRS